MTSRKISTALQAIVCGVESPLVKFSEFSMQYCIDKWHTEIWFNGWMAKKRETKKDVDEDEEEKEDPSINYKLSNWVNQLMQLSNNLMSLTLILSGWARSHYGRMYQLSSWWRWQWCATEFTVYARWAHTLFEMRRKREHTAPHCAPVCTVNDDSQHSTKHLTFKLIYLCQFSIKKFVAHWNYAIHYVNTSNEPYGPSVVLMKQTTHPHTKNPEAVIKTDCVPPEFTV